MNTALLTTFDHPNSWEYLRAINRIGIRPKAIISEYNPESVEKVRTIVRDRTGSEYKFLEIDEMCETLGIDIPFYFTDRINSEKTVKLIKSLKLDIVLFSADTIAGKEIINIPSIGLLNCHPALLPEYRGCNAVEWAIYHDRPVGSTCHIIDEGIDTGPIVYKKEMPIYKEDNYEQIRARSILFTAQVMAEGVRRLLAREKPQPQREEDGRYFPRMDEQELQIVKDILRQKKYSHYIK